MKKTIQFLYKGKSYTTDVERDGSTLTIEREGTKYTVTLLEEKKAVRPKPAAKAPAASPVRPAAAPAPAPAAAAPTGGAGALGAPMTGTIKEIKVSSGEQVTLGQLLIVMEAMKMDIEVFADRAGSVKDIYVKPGDTVREKQPLIEIG